MVRWSRSYGLAHMHDTAPGVSEPCLRLCTRRDAWLGVILSRVSLNQRNVSFGHVTYVHGSQFAVAARVHHFHHELAGGREGNLSNRRVSIVVPVPLFFQHAVDVIENLPDVASWP